MSELSESGREILRAALALPEGERLAFINKACMTNSDLLRQVEQLVASEVCRRRSSEGLEPESRPAVTVTGRPGGEERPGTVIGHYKLLEKIGEGGFGAVYVAEQREPVKRRVALKIIKLGMDTQQVVARFEAERQALALMDHPNIAKVLDAGSTRGGRPFFVMELVRGIKITEYCDQSHFNTRDRVELFIKVCQAIQHAHQKGIIHRDIKPSNILVTLHDGVAVPKVIDFGIAKATQGGLTEQTIYTQFHQFIGTPAYMSPEQAEMSGLDIDTRSDIYSLGVLLYELLVGKTPFDGRELIESGVEEMRRILREREPVRPSTRFSTFAESERLSAAKRRGEEPAAMVGLIRGDLDWIVMKCLEKDRVRRYETANGVAMDLRRHLNNEPVLARPPSTGYRLQKAFRRNRVAFSAVAAVAVALLLGAVVSTWQAVRANRARVAQEQARGLAEQRLEATLAFVEDVFTNVAPKMQNLVGASKPQEDLTRATVALMENLRGTDPASPAFRLALARLYLQLSISQGGAGNGNALADYDFAVRNASNALAVLAGSKGERLSDEMTVLHARAERAAGNAALALSRNEEALGHFRRMARDAETLAGRTGYATEASRLRGIADTLVGSALVRMGRSGEAVTNHFLPYLEQQLAKKLTETSNFRDLHALKTAHELVGGAQRELGLHPAALAHLEEASRLADLLQSREPNNSRALLDIAYARADLGLAQVNVGRRDEGLKTLDAAMTTAENLSAKDEKNALFQAIPMHVARMQALAFAASADAAGLTVEERRHRLGRAQERLAHAEALLAPLKEHFGRTSLRTDLDRAQAEVNLRLQRLTTAPVGTGAGTGTSK